MKIITFTGNTHYGSIPGTVYNLLKNHGCVILRFSPNLSLKCLSENEEVYVLDDGSEVDLHLGVYERISSISLTTSNYITLGQLLSELISSPKECKLNSLAGVLEKRIRDFNSEIVVFDYPQDLMDNFTSNLLAEVIGNLGETVNINCEDKSLQIESNYMFSLGSCIYSYSNELLTQNFLEAITAALGLVGASKQSSTDRIQPINCDDLFLKYHKGGDLFENSNFETEFSEPEENLFSGENNGAGIIPILESAMPTKAPKRTVRIGIIAKSLSESAYLSLSHAIDFSAQKLFLDVEKVFMMRENLDFDKIDCIIIPGGFGVSETDTKLDAIKYARINNIPLLGICLGMQLAVIDICKNLIGLSWADSTEFNENCMIPVVIKYRKRRLGSLKVALKGTLRDIYKKKEVFEKHRHEYCVNKIYFDALRTHATLSIYGDVLEAIELKDHPFFVAVQYHPELISTKEIPHPLFTGLLKAVIKESP